MTNGFSALFPVVVVAGSLLTACGGGDMHDQGTGSMGNELQAARMEVDRHHNAVMNAPTLAELPTELQRHMGQMGTIRTQMNGTMDGMMTSHCSGSAMSSMHGMIGSMGEDLLAHQNAMSHAATLDEARSRCAAYTDTMHSLFQNMQNTLGNMGCTTMMN